MKILYYDCFAGISGDMNLGAMVDIGIEPEYLVSELKKLNVEGYHIEVKTDQRKGIFGTKVDVVLTDQEHTHKHAEDKKHSHGHQHDHKHHHPHDHDHPHEQHNHTHHHHGEHRNLKDIEKILSNSSLSEEVKNRSLKMFLEVAKAEAKVHNKDLYEIHFHEVGAIDSIVDIIGAAICHEKLGVEKIMASPIELGGGFVQCAHGKFPVPAPATAEILKNKPIKSGIVPFETTTPTGAAIIAANVDEFSTNTNFEITKVAYGIGGRDTEIPNVLRVYLGQDNKDKMNWQTEDGMVVECNIDDMNPEMYAVLFDELFAKGALDVYLTPIMMKKSRPANTLSVICTHEVVDKIKECIFLNTTSIGVREYPVLKTMLRREFETVNTKYGDVKVKNSLYKGKVIHSKPEFDDCKRLSQENGVSLKEIYNSIKQ